MKISNFLKTHFLVFTFIDDFTLNNDNIKKIEVSGYAGFCWPSLAFLVFMALDKFLKQSLVFESLWSGSVCTADCQSIKI